MRDYLCSDILGRRKPPKSILYTYGDYTSLGENAAKPRPRLTSGVPQSLLKGRVLETRGDDQVMPRRGNTNEIHGDYTIHVDGVEFIITWGKPKRVYSQEHQRDVEIFDPEMQNLPNGMLEVDVNASYDYFCFLDLHPMNVTSPVRCADECQGKGVSVTAGPEFMRRNCLIKPDARLVGEAAKIERDYAVAGLVSHLYNADDAELQRWFRACGGVLDPNHTDKRREQMVTKLKTLLESRETPDAHVRNKLVALMGQDPARARDLINEAVALGVLSFDGEGNYKCGEIDFSMVVYPEDRAGSEADFLAEQIVLHRLEGMLGQIDTEVQVVRNRIFKEGKRNEPIDRHMDMALAEKVVFPDLRMKQWKVRTKSGSEVMLKKYDPALTEDENRRVLREWARDQGLAFVKQKIAIPEEGVEEEGVEDGE